MPHPTQYMSFRRRRRSVYDAVPLQLHFVALYKWWAFTFYL